MGRHEVRAGIDRELPRALGHVEVVVMEPEATRKRERAFERVELVE